MVGCLRYLLHTGSYLTYSVGMVSRYMQSLRESHAYVIKQILRYIKGTTSFGIKYNRSNEIKLVGYSDSSHNVDIDDGRSTTGHVFYLGTSPITWCSQKQTTMALSSCEAEFMAATAVTCQAIWLREFLAEVTGLERQKVIIRVDNKSVIALSKNQIFHGRSKHIHTRYHFIRECMENEQVIVEHVSRENQRADPLTKAFACIRFKKMRLLLGVQELPFSTHKFKGISRTTVHGSITGLANTDGIGKAFAFQLAQKGLDLILVSRNLAKLKQVSNEITLVHPTTKIKVFDVDFSSDDVLARVKGMQEVIRDEKLDVGVLINNVGVTYPVARFFHEVDEEVWTKVVKVKGEGKVWCQSGDQG
ncbi:uncharacterized mitochondrial protein-like protein [Tanacetum coccineum]